MTCCRVWKTDSCYADPRYEEEVSGCTASVGILSAKKIYVVSHMYSLLGGVY
jgi:hypothetical protein